MARQVLAIGVPAALEQVMATLGFLVLAPVMALLMWQRFRRTVAEF